jgi:hypothetical protein
LAGQYPSTLQAEFLHPLSDGLEIVSRSGSSHGSSYPMIERIMSAEPLSRNSRDARLPFARTTAFSAADIPSHLLPLGGVKVPIRAACRNHLSRRFDLSFEDGAAINRLTNVSSAIRRPDAEH